MEPETGGRISLQIEVAPEEMAPDIAEALNRLARKVRVPGFRPGRAPASLVERVVGRARVLQEALDPLVQRFYRAAVEQEAVEAIGQAEFDVRRFNDGEPLEFVATVPVQPEVRLPDYAALKPERQVAVVSEADVDQALEQLRRRHAPWVPCPGPAQGGDLVVLNIQGTLEGGMPIREPQRESVLGSGSLRPEIEAAVVGLLPGGSVKVEFVVPATDPDPHLAGKRGRVTVTLVDLKRSELAELDDAFARDVSDHETLEELRTDLRNSLQRSAEQRASAAAAEQWLVAIADASEVDVPDVLVDEQVALLLENLRRELGLTPEQWQAVVAEREAAGDGGPRAQVRETAALLAKRHLVLEAIARAEAREPRPEQVEAEIDRVAAESGRDAARVREWLSRPEARRRQQSQLAQAKGFDYLVERLTAAEAAGVTAGLADGAATAADAAGDAAAATAGAGEDGAQ